MKNYVCLLLTSALLLSVFYMLPVVRTQETKNGDISFQPNVIPNLIVSSRVGKNNESFRLEWLGNKLDLELFFNATYKNKTRLFSLRDFEDDFNVTVNYIVNRTNNVQFGWVIDRTENVSEFVHNALFKIEDTQPFDYEDIELDEFETVEGNNITRFNLPDNLILSFEDLKHKGFVVGPQNKTSVSVKGFKGKSKWDLDPITFSSPRITVIGGTSLNPLGYDDIWVGDKAGTLELLANTTAGNLTLTTQVRPADNKSIVLDIIANNVTGNQWCNITGTEKDDSVQTENISITLNQTYTTSSYWKTVSYLNCSSSGWNITVQQGQWGVVWKQSTTQYAFDANIFFGNATVAGTTWFNDTLKQITFNDNIATARYFRWQEGSKYAYITFGELVDASSKSSKNGVDFINLDSSHWVYFFFTYTGENYFYSCSFTSVGRGILQIVDGHLYNAFFKERSDVLSRTNMDYFNILIQSAIGAISYPGGIWNRVTVTDCSYAFFIRYSGSIRNVYATGCNGLASLSNFNWGDKYLINVESDTWILGWDAGSMNELWRQYDFDLNVTNSAGVPIQNANVTVRHYGQGEAQDFSVLTGSNGSFATQTLSMGFYNRTGDDTIYNYNPYSITVTASGYSTYTKNFTFTEQEDWTIALQSAEGFDSTYYLLGAVSFMPLLFLTVIWRKKKKNAS